MNMNTFTAADHANLERLACLFETAEMLEPVMSAHEFNDGIAHAILADFGNADVTGAMFANVARKLFQSCRDSRHAHGSFGAASNIAVTIRAYIERHNSTNC